MEKQEQRDDHPTVVVETFLEFLDEVGDDPDREFERFLLDHPDIDSELREVRKRWTFVETVLESAGISGDEPGNSADSSNGVEIISSHDLLRRLSSRGDLLTRYELRGVIARGGTSTVWRAWDRDLGRMVAMKILDELGEETVADERRLSRFLREARVASQLNHPGIPPVYEIGVDDAGCVYFTMKLVEGSTLRELIEEHSSDSSAADPADYVGILLRICDAMAYSHEKGVLHRDLKPSNVLVGRFGEVSVVDWGLARPNGAAEVPPSPAGGSPTGTARLWVETADREVLGTPAYMSPEQARGRRDEISIRSDVYSVGAILYHMLVGAPPYFERGSKRDLHTVLQRVREQAPTSVGVLAPRTPPELQSICEKAMARSPESRFAGMEELAADLRAYREGRVVRAYRSGPVSELKSWFGRHPRTAVTASVLAIAALCLSFVGLSLRTEAIVRQRTLALFSIASHVDELIERAPRLWPPRPGLSADYLAWREEAQHLEYLWHNAGYALELRELRSKAVRRTESRSPELGERRLQEWNLRDKRARLEVLSGAEQTLLGSRQPKPARLAWADRATDAAELLAETYPLVHPTRVLHGRETEGWALALRALELASTDSLRAEAWCHVAWAKRALGLHAEAIEAADQAGRLAPSSELDRLGKQMRRNSGLAGVRTEQERLKREIRELEASADERCIWVLANAEDQARHDQLAQLADELDALLDKDGGLLLGAASGQGWSVGRRLEFLEALTTPGESRRELEERWSTAQNQIAANPRYSGIDLEPHWDLFPIGIDPASGLNEFVHLQTGDPAGRDAAGRAIVLPSTGVILVLIPAGEFVREIEPLEAQQTVRVNAHFLAKHEMTQGQWLRLTGDNPSRFTPGYFSGDQPVQLTHPVEEVSWEECRRTLSWAGLTFPTEAQLEYAGRAGSTTAWHTGADDRSLAGAANLAYVTHPGAEPPEEYEWHAPVGSFAPNAFGLFDVHGNVREWCLDAVQTDLRRWGLTAVDPVVHPDESRRRARLYRCIRGGSFESQPDVAAFGTRDRESPEYRAPDLGLRPARALDDWDVAPRWPAVLGRPHQ